MPRYAINRILDTAYRCKSDQKGGTIIKKGVTDREQHEKLLAAPDGYRPCSCPTCGPGKLHAHDKTFRGTATDPESQFEIRRYECVECEAIWRVLPEFLPRHLHRRWEVVQWAMVEDAQLSASGEEGEVRVPRSTRARWRSRLATRARVVLKGLAALGGKFARVVKRLGRDATRGEVVEALARAGLLAAGSKLSQLACLIHQVLPGVRLM